MDKHFDAELLLIGEELLKGERQDQHLRYFGKILQSIGICISSCFFVGDEEDRIAEIVRARLPGTRVLFVCGGLGPTEDDVTRSAVAKGLGEPLEFSESSWEEIQSYFTKAGRPISKANRRQAYFPKGAVPISNWVGTAPGFSIEKSGCLVFVLPGPPRELIPMVKNVALPRLGRIFHRESVFSETFRTTGIGESTLASLIEHILHRYEMFDFSYLFSASGVDIIARDRRSTEGKAVLDKHAEALEHELKRILGHKLYAKGTTLFEAVLGEVLARKGMTLSVAESLTGGLIGKRLTDVPGSSRYFLADVVSYSNESKIEMLGVSQATLMRVGAVSEEVCIEMAKGVRQKTGATWGLSTTGIAGPDGGTEEKPVGLCYYGLAWQGGETAKKAVFPGDRYYIRERVTYASLYLLYRHLMGDRGIVESS